MTVQIHINGENAAQAIEELSVLASHLTPSTGATAPTTQAPKEDKAAESTRSTSRSKAAEKVKDPEPKKEDEVKAPSADPEPAVEELRAKAAEVAKSGKQAGVKELLTKFEAASISAVPEDKRNEFMKELEAL